MAAEHWIIHNARGAPVKCAVGKRAEKAKLEASNMPGYTVKQIGRDRCPFCTPKAGQSRTEEVEEVYEEPEVPDKPGQCHLCKSSEPGQYKLRIVNHILVRACKLCGAWYDLQNLIPWEGTRT